jgi:ubiquinone/menaquinone biosynthesis C-methylase UbiE
MDSYGEFAGVYDRLMDDFDYPRWAEYYLQIIAKTGIKPRRICDCACGTGSMSVEFAKLGLNVTGVDLSADMLRIAAVKARRSAQKIIFAQQDMAHLTLPRPVDAVICACDGVNYLADGEALSGFFRAASAAIKPGGCIAFDISSRYKLEEIIGDGFFGEERDDVAYLWSNKCDRNAHIIDMDLTFFIRCDDDRYRRFTETHRQRAHSRDEICAALEGAGFTDINVYGDRTLCAPAADEKRLHFTAIKG